MSRSSVDDEWEAGYRAGYAAAKREDSDAWKQVRRMELKQQGYTEKEINEMCP